MPTITVRNLPDDIVDRLKQVAEAHHRSMEQEVRDLLQRHYGPRQELLRRVQERWDRLPQVTREEVDGWRDEGRP